jgi:hypothetical protein
MCICVPLARKSFCSRGPIYTLSIEHYSSHLKIFTYICVIVYHWRARAFALEARYTLLLFSFILCIFMYHSFTLMRSCTLTLLRVTLLRVPTHSYAFLHTLTRSYTLLRVPTHSYAHLHTLTRSYTLLRVHLPIFMFISHLLSMHGYILLLVPVLTIFCPFLS